MGLVLGPTNIFRCTFDLHMILYQNPIVQYGYGPGLGFGAGFVKLGGMKKDIIGIPFARGLGSHGQRNGLLVNGAYLTIDIGFVVIIVQHLHLIPAL